MRSFLLTLLIAATASAAAADCGICPGGNATGSVGSFPSASLSLQASPVGNPYTTWTSLSIEGATGQADEREFLVSLGLRSTQGNESRPTPFHDKVTLYAAVEAGPGTGDVWAINPLLTQLPGSGAYNAQGIELDFNNANAHRGEADAGDGLAPPVSYGLSITGSAPFRNTAALAVMGDKHMWNRGLVFANDCVAQSSFQDLGSPQKSIDIRGSPAWGVYQASPSSKNLFAGGTGVGLPSPASLDARAALHVGAGGLRVDGPAVFSDRAEGTAVLDARGEALVVVAAVAARAAGGAALRGAAYGLTALGAPMPNLHVAEEAAAAADGAVAFRVAGGAPGKRVSWRLTLGADE
jgi:hypothetical protein